MALTRAPSHDPQSKAYEKQLRRSSGAGRGAFVAGIVVSCAGGIALIVQCWLLARVISGVVLGTSSRGEVMAQLWALLAVMVLRAGLDVLRQGLAFESAARIKQDLRRAVLDKMTALGPVWMERQSTGAIVETLNTGIENIEAYFAAYLPQRIIASVLPIAILVAVFPQDWVSGLILLITAPIVPMFMIIIGKGAETLSRRQWTSLSRMGAHFFDIIAGLTTLHQFDAIKRQSAIIRQMSESYRSASMKVLRVAFLSSLVLEFFATISVAMVAVYVGFRLYYGDIAFLPGLFALLLAPEFFRPLRDMGAFYHARMDAIGAAEGIMPILTAPVPDVETGTALVSAPVKVRFDRVGFQYDNGLGVRDVTFTLHQGQCLALVGPSGAGKTTIAKLLMGIRRPQSGDILVDGVSLNTISAAAWHTKLGWMPQNPTLFGGTIRDNIRLAKPDASDDDVIAAARVALAHDFITAFPEGYDKRVGDGGRGVSGGQAQRIALARVLITQPAVLILDEPTAALDLKMGRALMDNLRRARPDAMILLITHDPALAAHANEIVRLDEIAAMDDAGGSL